MAHFLEREKYAGFKPTNVWELKAIGESKLMFTQIKHAKMIWEFHKVMMPPTSKKKKYKHRALGTPYWH